MKFTISGMYPETENSALARNDNLYTYTLTNADKSDIATLVLNQIPVATGVNF